MPFEFTLVSYATVQENTYFNTISIFEANLYWDKIQSNSSTNSKNLYRIREINKLMQHIYECFWEIFSSGFFFLDIHTNFVMVIKNFFTNFHGTLSQGGLKSESVLRMSPCSGDNCASCGWRSRPLIISRLETVWWTNQFKVPQWGQGNIRCWPLQSRITGWIGCNQSHLICYFTRVENASYR